MLAKKTLNRFDNLRTDPRFTNLLSRIVDNATRPSHRKAVALSTVGKENY